jgi:superfamily II DNA or RNA helicase
MKTKDEIQKEASKEIDKHYRCSVAVSMGVGKTYIALKDMKKHFTDLSTYAVIVPKRSNIVGWRQEIIKQNMSGLLDHIEFITYRSLHKTDLNKYDAVYLDECHNLLYSHEKALSNYKYRILGLTGTPPTIKSSEKYRMMEEFCPVVYNYLVEEAVEDKILNNYIVKICYLNLNTSKTIKKTTKAGRIWYTSEKDSYDFWTKAIDEEENLIKLKKLRIMRMKELQSFPSKTTLAKSIASVTSSQHKKCIIFCNTKDQADTVCEHSYHSTNPDSTKNLEKFNAGKIRKLSCVLQLSEGINIKDLDSGIIMHAYSNEVKLSQRLGRLLRLSPDKEAVVYILVYKNTIDEVWTNKALETLNPQKIEYIQF